MVIAICNKEKSKKWNESQNKIHGCCHYSQLLADKNYKGQKSAQYEANQFKENPWLQPSWWS